MNWKDPLVSYQSPTETEIARDFEPRSPRTMNISEALDYTAGWPRIEQTKFLAPILRDIDRANQALARGEEACDEACPREGKWCLRHGKEWE